MHSKLEVDSTRQNYDRLSRWYDLFSGSEHPFKMQGLKMLAPGTQEEILEIGCGTGKLLVELARNAGHVTGLDISPGMLSVCRRRLDHLKTALHNITLLEGDARNIPVEDLSIDGIFAAFTLELFPPSDMQEVLDECRRILRPGGRLVTVSLSDQGRQGLMYRLYQWTRRHWPHVVDCRPIHSRGLLQEAGFVVTDHTFQRMWGLGVDITSAQKS